MRLGHAGIVDHFVSFIDTRLKKNIERKWTDTILLFFMLYKCIMANTSAIWQQAAHTNYHLLGAQQEPYKKA